MALQNRYEFMYYVACTNANPNGDPDMGNMPRIDPQTMQGLITDVATKRRIRSYIEIAYPGVPGMGIFVQKSVTLNRLHWRDVKQMSRAQKERTRFTRRAERRANSSMMCVPLAR